MNTPLKNLDSILDAFKRGYRDAYHRGVFNDIYEDDCSYSYKQGYDFGMTIYCEINLPKKEEEEEI